jgi:putative ABC transport system ATP-binding protein
MNTTTAPSVSLSNVQLTLSNSAGEVNILRGIDCHIKPGETVGIIGPSGSGKTSLLMVIAGLEQPSAGTVNIAGTIFNGLSEDAQANFRRDHIGIVFQDFHLIPTMTALENVALPLEFAGMLDASARAHAGLTSVGLAHRVTHYPGQLSGGEQQRVAITRAFATNPAILLADEPTGNLDGDTSDTVMDTLFDLHANHNTTLILITHEPEVAERCSRVITLTDGRITNDTSTEVSAVG